VIAMSDLFVGRNAAQRPWIEDAVCDALLSSSSSVGVESTTPLACSAAANDDEPNHTVHGTHKKAHGATGSSSSDKYTTTTLALVRPANQSMIPPTVWRTMQKSLLASKSGAAAAVPHWIWQVSDTATSIVALVTLEQQNGTTTATTSQQQQQLLARMMQQLNSSSWTVVRLSAWRVVLVESATTTTTTTSNHRQTHVYLHIFHAQRLGEVVMGGGGGGGLCAPQKPPPRSTTGIHHASHQASSEPLQPPPPPHACCYPVMDTIAARRALLARQRWGLNVEQSVVLPTKMAEANATAIVTAANYASSNHSNNDDGDDTAVLVWPAAAVAPPRMSGGDDDDAPQQSTTKQAPTMTLVPSLANVEEIY
jgi:hypothetical protein